MTRPHVTLKLATSLDGRIATASGESRWITGPEARAEVHRMRATADAVMIGAGTARADNPSLLARTEPPPQRQPKRVVIASDFNIPSSSALFRDLEQSPVIVIGASADQADRVRAAGAKIGIVSSRGGHVDLTGALQLLAKEWSVRTVLAEGGGTLAAALLREGLVDRLELMRAPILLGGDGKPTIANLDLRALSDAPAWRRVALRELGPDLWESYERI